MKRKHKSWCGCSMCVAKRRKAERQKNRRGWPLPVSRSFLAKIDEYKKAGGDL